jgi:hypothetical protein
MPPVTTAVLGAFGVPPAATIVAALLALATALGLVQARNASPRPAAVTAK